MASTILIIDGELSQRELLCMVLKEKLSYATLGLANGREAAQYLLADHTPKPDLILFDTNASEGGVETIAHLRLITTNLPLVALVKYGDQGAARAALNAGAQDFLHKPVSIERMGTTLNNMLILRDARRESEWLRHNRQQEHGSNGGNGVQPRLSFSFLNEDGHVRRMEDTEAEAIRFAMQFYNGRMTEVARRLGIGRSTLYRKLNDFSLRQREAA